MDFESVKSAAAGRWPEIVERLTGLPQDVFRKGSSDHPCPKCGGKSVIWPTDDATTSGSIACRNCTENRPTGDGIATVAAFAGIGQGEAAKLIADHIGSRATDHKPKDIEIIDAVCRAKKMPREAFEQFGVTVATRGRNRAKVARVDVYNSEGVVHSYFDMAPTGKGKLKFGEGTSGMFFPGRLPAPGEQWLIVEGVKDAAALVGLAFNAAGTNGSFLPAPFAKLFADCDIILVPDLDSAGQVGASRSGGHLSGIAKSIRVARLPGEAVEKGGADVRDVIARHGEDAVRQEITSATQWTPREGEEKPEDGRPSVIVGPIEAIATDEVVSYLGKLGWETPWVPARLRESVKVYVRGGVLVDTIEAEDADRKGHLVVRSLPSAILRERITQACQLFVERVVGDEIRTTPARPPKWIIDAIHSRGWFGGKVRPLSGIVASPTIREDGSVLQAQGYDRASGLIYRPRESFPTVPPEPTRDDAKQAADALLEAVIDFPFHDPADKSAWLALVLTLIARPSIRGCTPMFVVTKNIRGAGGSLLVDCATQIAYGRAAARQVFTRDDDELRKILTAVAIEAVPSVLFDNLDQQLGGAALDAKITAETVSDRVLGSSKTTGEIPWRVVLMATGNHVAFGSDVGRRVLPIRLSTPLESPEDREGFRHPDLMAWIRENRPRLAVAALTIVRAYFAAGRPDQPGGVWGSFESWTATIRGALVWAGLPDPLPTRIAAMANDDSRNLLAMLVTGLEEIDPDGQGVTVKEIERLTTHRPDAAPTCPTLVAAVAEVCGERFNAKRFGKRLRSFANRTWEGRQIVFQSGHGGVLRWSVRTVSAAGGGFHADAGGFGGFDISETHHSATRNFVDENAVGGFGGFLSYAKTHDCVCVSLPDGGTCDTFVQNTGPEVFNPPNPLNPPEPEPIADQTAKPEPTRYPCERCGAKLVRLPTTQIIGGWVNLDCPTRGCGHVKPVKVADKPVEVQR